ncbi:MAG: hypothetical protein AAF485_21455 [Chloroflexota bacterium]
MKTLIHFLSYTKTRLFVAVTIAFLMLGLGYIGITPKAGDIQASPLNQPPMLILPIVKTSDQVTVYSVTNNDLGVGMLNQVFYSGGYPSGTMVTNFIDTYPGLATKIYTATMISIPDGFVGDVAIFSTVSLTGTTTILRPTLTVTMKADPDIAQTGDVITYTYHVTNTGIFTFTLISGNDEKLGRIPFSPTILAPGHDTIGVLTYTVSISESLDPLTHTVVASGTVSGGTTVTATALTTVTLQPSDVKVYLPLILKSVGSDLAVRPLERGAPK